MDKPIEQGNVDLEGNFWMSEDESEDVQFSV